MTFIEEMQRRLAQQAAPDAKGGGRMTSSQSSPNLTTQVRLLFLCCFSTSGHRFVTGIRPVRWLPCLAAKFAGGANVTQPMSCWHSSILHAQALLPQTNRSSSVLFVVQLSATQPQACCRRRPPTATARRPGAAA